VHVDPIKPTLTAHGSKRLKPCYGNLHSTVAFNFNLRRYLAVERASSRPRNTRSFFRWDTAASLTWIW